MTRSVWSRRAFAKIAGSAGILAAAPAGAATTPQHETPCGAGTEWQWHASPEAAGFKAAQLSAIEKTLFTLPTTSLMILKDDRLVYTYGDTSVPSYLASARKSIVAMLYGTYVENGTIKLDSTMGELGIDESNGGLLPIEKTATIRDLLMSSSGVYFPAGSPGGVVSDRARGSSKPGETFVYNNWDFNVLGAIFEKLTGMSVFKALAENLAGPLGFQDFDLSRQRMLGFATGASRYQAYHLFLSARDMAKLGVTMVQGGRWNGKQIVPASWVKESTTLRVPGSATHIADGALGYGYLWWIPTAGRSSAEWQGSYLADGNYGQFILGLPAIGVTVVHRRALTDEFAIARNLGDTEVNPPPVTIEAFLKIADQIVAARQD